MPPSFKPYPFTPRHYEGVVPPLVDGRDPVRRVHPTLQKIRDAAGRRASVSTESCKA